MREPLGIAAISKPIGQFESSEADAPTHVPLLRYDHGTRRPDSPNRFNTVAYTPTVVIYGPDLITETENMDWRRQYWDC